MILIISPSKPLTNISNSGPEKKKSRGKKRRVDRVVKNQGEPAESGGSFREVDMPETDIRALVEFLGPSSDHARLMGSDDDWLARYQDMGKDKQAQEKLHEHKDDTKYEIPTGDITDKNTKSSKVETCDIFADQDIESFHIQPCDSTIEQDIECSKIQLRDNVTDQDIESSKVQPDDTTDQGIECPQFQPCESTVDQGIESSLAQPYEPIESDEAQFGNSESNADLVPEPGSFTALLEQDFDAFMEDQRRMQFRHQLEFQECPVWDENQGQGWNQDAMYSMNPNLSSSVMGDCGSYPSASFMAESMAEWYADPTTAFEPDELGMATEGNSQGHSQQFSTGGEIWVDNVDYDPAREAETSHDAGVYPYADDPSENKENTAPDNNVIDDTPVIGGGAMLSEPISVTQNGTTSWTHRYSGEYNEQYQFVPFGPLRPVPGSQGHVPSVNVSSQSERTFAHEWFGEIATHVRDVDEDPINVADTIRNAN